MDDAKRALVAALRALAAASAAAGAQTRPHTPLPRLPRRWGSYFRECGAPNLPWVHDGARRSEFGEPRAGEWRYPPHDYGESEWADEWADALAASAQWKPAKIARLIRAIEADTRWMERCVEMRQRMAAEILRQQQRWMDELNARMVALKL